MQRFRTPIILSAVLVCQLAELWILDNYRSPGAILLCIAIL